MKHRRGQGSLARVSSLSLLFLPIYGVIALALPELQRPRPRNVGSAPGVVGTNGEVEVDGGNGHLPCMDRIRAVALSSLIVRAAEGPLGPNTCAWPRVSDSTGLSGLQNSYFYELASDDAVCPGALLLRTIGQTPQPPCWLPGWGSCQVCPQVLRA